MFCTSSRKWMRESGGRPLIYPLSLTDCRVGRLRRNFFSLVRTFFWSASDVEVDEGWRDANEQKDAFLHTFSVSSTAFLVQNIFSIFSFLLMDQIYCNHFLIFILLWVKQTFHVGQKTKTFLKISSFVFSRRKKVIQVWNNMRMNYYFNPLVVFDPF